MTKLLYMVNFPPPLTAEVVLRCHLSCCLYFGRYPRTRKISRIRGDKDIVSHTLQKNGTIIDHLRQISQDKEDILDTPKQRGARHCFPSFPKRGTIRWSQCRDIPQTNDCPSERVMKFNFLKPQQNCPNFQFFLQIFWRDQWHFATLQSYILIFLFPKRKQTPGLDQ